MYEIFMNTHICNLILLFCNTIVSSHFEIKLEVLLYRNTVFIVYVVFYLYDPVQYPFIHSVFVLYQK